MSELWGGLMAKKKKQTVTLVDKSHVSNLYQLFDKAEEGSRN